jgi:hypothetical protein
MTRSNLTPRTVPYGADQTVYLVVDRFRKASVYRETELERTDLETLIADFMTGQFNGPVRVIAEEIARRSAGGRPAYAPTLLRARCRDWSVIASRVLSFKAKVSDSA